MLTVTAIAFAVRLILGLLYPNPVSIADPGGDTIVYLRVAENIFRHACISLSNPLTDACHPTWGNHLPLYPLLIAGTWILGPKSLVTIRFLQSLIAAAAIARLAYAVGRYTRSHRVALMTGLVLAVSGVTVMWPRFVLVDGLATAATAWVFAELILCFVEGRLRTGWIAAAATFALWMREDSVLLAVPIALTGLLLHSFSDAFKQGLVLALVLGTPVAVWIIHGISMGLQFPPPPILRERSELSEGVVPSVSLAGYFSWWQTWTLSIFDERAALDPVTSPARNYDGIILPDRAFWGASDETQVRKLMQTLEQMKGQPMPKAVDDEFGRLARNRRTGNPIYFLAWVPLKRMIWMWITPFDSTGWPSPEGLSLTEELRKGLSGRSRAGTVAVFSTFPLFTLGKLYAIGWRYISFLAIGPLVVMSRAGKWSGLRPLIWVAMAYILTRSFALAVLGFVDTRYTVEFAPIIESIVAIALAALLASSTTGTNDGRWAVLEENILL